MALFKSPPRAAIAAGAANPVARAWARLLVAVGLPHRDRTPQDAMRAQKVSYTPLNEHVVKLLGNDVGPKLSQTV